MPSMKILLGLLTLCGASLLALAQDTAATRKAVPTFAPRFMGLFHGDTLRDVDMLKADGGLLKLSELKSKATIIAFLPPVALSNAEWPVRAKLSEFARRYAPYEVRTVAIVNWMQPAEFRTEAAKQLSAWPCEVYGDPQAPYAGDPADSDALIAHNKSTLLGRITGGMTPALPTVIVCDAQWRLMGSLMIQQEPALIQEGLSNLLLRAGVALEAKDKPRELAPDSAFVKPVERPKEAPVTMIEVGKPAPDFLMHDRNGQALRLSDYKGKVVVLDFWATWCGPCKAALPHVNEVAAKYREQGVVVIASCTNDEVEQFEKFASGEIKEYPEILFACDRLGRSPERASRKLYGVSGIPQQFIIGRDGIIAAQVTGYMKGEVLLDAALAKAGIKVDEALLKQAQEDLRRREELNKKPASKPAVPAKPLGG
jgi:thiol-disulfide isomerase/thioredoxin